MQARMKNPVFVIPGALEALQALAASTEKGAAPKRTLELVHLRGSMINGCGVCLDHFATAHTSRMRSRMAATRSKSHSAAACIGMCASPIRSSIPTTRGHCSNGPEAFRLSRA
jgi:AhpD family alkylhydroperoxidase